MSERKQQICVEICNLEKFNILNDWPPENPQGFLKWFEEKISQIPLEFMGKAQVEIDGRMDYDCSVAAIKIYYIRPETDQELARRIAERERVYAAAAPLIERQERAELARLKAKYEPEAE